MACLHESAPRNAHRSDNDFLPPEGGSRGSDKVTLQNSRAIRACYGGGRAVGLIKNSEDRARGQKSGSDWVDCMNYGSEPTI